MRRLLVRTSAMVCPILAFAVIAGCGGTPTQEENKQETKEASKKATVLEGEYTGTITGKVTFKGDKPDFARLNEELQAQMKAKDEAHCLTDVKPEDKDQTEQQSWRIDDKGGVANVFVWIAPPKGKFFHVDPAQKTWEDEVAIDQPHCAFIPHAVVTFPHYKDDKGKTVETKQKFLVKNSSKALNHNTNVTGGVNQTIPAGGAPLPVDGLEASSKPVYIKCDIHTWMNAYAGVFDHPYATITKKDGTFEIKNVPVGAEVMIYAWHEKGDYLNDGGAKGQPIKLDAKTSKDFSIEAK
jgi:hypothetical protein